LANIHGLWWGRQYFSDLGQLGLRDQLCNGRERRLEQRERLGKWQRDEQQQHDCFGRFRVGQQLGQERLEELG